MAGPHTVVIDLGSVQNINGIKIKSKETEDKYEPTYGITYIKDKKTVDIYGTQSYNPPHTFHIVFMNNRPKDDVINAFIAKKTWPTGITKTTFTSNNTSNEDNNINFYYGADKKTWWDNKLVESVTARYLFIHFEKGWNNAGSGGALSMVKVAELDIY